MPALSPTRPRATAILAILALTVGTAGPAAAGHAVDPARGAACAATARPGTPLTGALQDCGNWRYPVLCQVELRVGREESGWDALDAERPLAVPPGGAVELEILGRDQFGRGFPQARLALGADVRECAGLLDANELAQGRLRIEARALAGRCRLEVFVPGNLNFDWVLEIEIRRGDVAYYGRAQAETIVRGLYAAILGREPDAASFNPAVTEIQRGRFAAQLEAMLRSPEFGRRAATMDTSALLESFYQGLLGRPPDSIGVRDFMPLMEARRYGQVLTAIVRSPEYEDLRLR